jgi:hypothetical protein
LTSPLLRALSPCHGPTVPFRPQATTVFQFTSATASSSSLPADRPHCASSLASLCSNWSFSAPPGLKAELGHVLWQPISLPSHSRLIAQLALPPPPPHPAHPYRIATATGAQLTWLCRHGAPPQLSGRTWPASSVALQLQRALRPGPRYALDALALAFWLRGGLGWPVRSRHRRLWPLVVATGPASSAAPVPPPRVGA